MLKHEINLQLTYQRILFLIAPAYKAVDLSLTLSRDKVSKTF